MEHETRNLYDTATGKICNIRLQGNKLITETGKPDKPRVTEKEFTTTDEAQKAFIKKEWETLKKGFVLRNENVKAGEPFLHYFVGGGYTGCLSFCSTPAGIFVYKNKLPYKGKGDKDYLLLIDNTGNCLKEIELPEILAWDIDYNPTTNSLLLDIDHSIYDYHVENDTFNKLADGKRGVTSFVGVSGNRNIYATNKKFYITDCKNRLLLESDYETKTVKGTTPFCMQLSDDGTILALNTKIGEIQLINTTTGNLINKITADFEMFKQMEFTSDNTMLICMEQYGTWGMRYFDLSNNKELPMKSLEITSYSKEVNAFCLNADQSKLVLIHGDNAFVYDFNKKKLLYSFKIYHVVKSLQAKFVGDKLGIRTDYGCFSLYNV